MKKIFLSLCFLVLLLNVQAEELIWFSLNCNLRNADIIVQSEIIDDDGNLKIEKYYKGKLANTKGINLSEFALHPNEKIEEGFPKEKGRKVILFINLGKNMELQPAFLGWTLSTLWIESNKYWGVLQKDNPGGYVLYPFIKTESELKLKVDNWVFLEQAITKSDEIESATNRINYLLEIFYWHPFKEDIIERLSVEDGLGIEQIENLIWNIFSHQYLSKSKLYPCGIQDYHENNYFQLAFDLYKSVAGEKYEKRVLKFINSLKSHIDYMEHKASSELNENFVIELTKFLNINPSEDWDKEKIEIQEIIRKNEPYYNHLFIKSLENELK